MSKRLGPVVMISGALGLLTAPLVCPALFSGKAATALTAADTDSDGTLDLSEVKAAAAAEFDKLDTDKDGTLDAKEVGDRITQESFASADPDKDGKLSKDEYVALAVSLFKAADPDGDGTLDAKELHSDAGVQLDHVIE
jgi:hypothetical protein